MYDSVRPIYNLAAIIKKFDLHKENAISNDLQER
jgi:hypothetical protein